MSNKKHIDRLFQEKFKDFEVNPDSKIWDNIQSEIAPKKEKKKRVIPIWFKYGGIAASLLLFLTVGITTFKMVSNTTNTIVDVETPNNNEVNNTTNHPNTRLNTPAVSISTTDGDINDIKTKKSSSNKNEEKISVANSSPVVSSDYTEKVTVKNKASIKEKTSNTIIVNSGSTYKNSINTKNKVNSIGTKNNTSKNNSTQTNPKYNGIAVISNSNVQKTANKEEAINNAINAVKEDTFSTGVTQSVKQDAINKIEKDKDSLQTNAIENAIAETESKKEKKDKKESANKWTVNANVAPVYYNTLNKGSHIDEQFVNNEKTGAINTSYGINVGYTITDKLKVRSGINTLNLGYDTNNVVVYESVANSGRGINTIDNLEISSLNTNGIGLTISSVENVNTTQLESFFVEEKFETAVLKQQINYIEIPVELEYALVDKRFGVNVVGGMSTFVLGKNEISTELRGTTTQIGRVNNINNISFSTNIGLGINYDFSKAFNLNLEPTFKYQLNAFDDTAGNFNPFILGVYTGLSYKF